MSNAELIAVLEKHATCEWDITNIDEGIITVNFYVDVNDEGDE